MKLNNSAELDALRKKLQADRDPERPRVLVCGGPGCSSLESNKVADAFEQKLQGVELMRTGCLGLCEAGPVVIIMPEGIFYSKVSVDDVDEIVKSIGDKHPIDRLFLEGAGTWDKLPFYEKQTRPLLDIMTKVDPESIDDYIAAGGYSALQKVLTMVPDKVVDEVTKSGLRGRGGGGFKTGRKWASAAKVQAEEKFVICNGDEGDPGAFMDRAFLEGDPHQVIEGMIIGAFAIGAKTGYNYVRAEYPVAVRRFQKAIDDAKEYGLLGENILGSAFSMDIVVYQGGGAFVCGESSALIQSIMGKAGEPRAKHTHATEKGLWESPTVLNNVETWANIPLIINQGGDEFAKVGTDGSKGTKIFSLVGKIKNTGLVEVPMGTTLKEIIFDIGGGIPEGRTFKAVQTGGPSGGCIPADKVDTPIDFDQLTELGSMMGSGGMIIMDDSTCMVDIARYFTKFNLEESCGKCTPCREGLEQMAFILDKIADGEAVEEDLVLLEKLANFIKKTSLCGLGKAAPNPTLTTLQYFRDEYMEHIKDKRCPALVCKALITFTVDSEKCVGCHLCAKRCPTEAATGENKQAHNIEQEKCVKCGACYEACKFGAIVKATGGAGKASSGSEDSSPEEVASGDTAGTGGPTTESTPDAISSDPPGSSSPETQQDGNTNEGDATQEGGDAQ